MFSSTDEMSFLRTNAFAKVLSARTRPELPDNSVVLADSGFGIFSVAYHSKWSGHDFLFRLSISRYKAFRKQAQLVDEGEGYNLTAQFSRQAAKLASFEPRRPKSTKFQKSTRGKKEGHASHLGIERLVSHTQLWHDDKNQWRDRLSMQIRRSVW